MSETAQVCVTPGCETRLHRPHGHLRCAECRNQAKGKADSAEARRVKAERELFAELTARWAPTTLEREARRARAAR